MSSGIPTIPEIPPVLRDASERGMLIPFVGAGASVLAGCPTWGQLADRALKACIDAKKFTYGQLEQINHLSPRVKLSIARGLENDHDFQIDYGALINPKYGYENNDVGNRVYRSLGKLGQTFVTTNYDSWLDINVPEIVAAVASPTAPQDNTSQAPSRRRAIYDIREFTPANLDQPRSVFHLHGSLADPSGMIITTRDYIERYADDRAGNDPQRENRTLTFLSYLFETKTVLFVGYGLEDLEILEYVVRKARAITEGEQAQARHFILQGYFPHQYELMRSMALYYSQFNIQLLPFSRDEKDWSQLVDVLDNFADKIPSTTLLNLQAQLDMERLLD